MFNDKKIESLFEGKGEAGADSELQALFAELKNLRDDVPAMQFGPERLKNAILNQGVSDAPRRSSAFWSRTATVAACGMAVFLISRGLNNPAEVSVMDTGAVAISQANEPEFSPVPQWWQESDFAPAEAKLAGTLPVAKSSPKATPKRRSSVRLSTSRSRPESVRRQSPVTGIDPSAIAEKSVAPSPAAASRIEMSAADLGAEGMTGETAVVVTGRSDQRSGARNAIEVKNLDELVLGS